MPPNPPTPPGQVTSQRPKGKGKETGIGFVTEPSASRGDVGAARRGGARRPTETHGAVTAALPRATPGGESDPRGARGSAPLRSPVPRLGGLQPSPAKSRLIPAVRSQWPPVGCHKARRSAAKGPKSAAGMGTVSAEMGTASEEMMGVGSTEVGAMSTNSGTETTGTGMGTTGTEMGTMTTQMGAMSTEMGTMTTQMGAMSTGMETTTAEWAASGTGSVQVRGRAPHV